MATPADAQPDPKRLAALDRRGFLLGAAGAIAVTQMSCAGNDDLKRGAAATPTAAAGARASTPGEALAKPGSRGLVAEQVYQERVDEYLAFATTDPSSTNPVGVGAHLIRAAREPAYTWDVASVGVDTFADSWDRLDNWKDTRDFDLMYLTWLLELGQGSTAGTRLSPAVLDAIKQRLLANRYRYDDPLPVDRLDNQWFWSENHLIIGLANEYLAGQRFPDETFTVTGLTGRSTAIPSKPDILEWVHERAKLGFFEWHSNVYMLKNITPLLMLVEMADDPERRHRGGDGSRPVPARHRSAPPRRLLHRAPRTHLQEGQDVVARREHLRYRQARLRRHEGAVPVEHRRWGHLLLRRQALPPAPAPVGHRHLGQDRRGARTPRRVLRRQRRGHRQPHRTLRARLLQGVQPALLVEPRRDRHVAARRGERRRGEHVPTLGHRAVLPGQAPRRAERLRPGEDPRSWSRPARR